jgi:DNA invertase Pin-like site-specific DNA recombinase
MTHKLTPAHLQRRAIVYVRQSTPTQLVQNRESQLRQYGLADYARELGFAEVETIDQDLGRSGSGLIERPGFQRLVAEVCESRVGAVFCLEASRLARNGRDWHHLIELCGLVGSVLVDLDGIYDPRLSNDRLLLGLRGTMSEFELSVLRQRSLEAIRQKAARGELRFCLPVGFGWTQNEKIELDPDLRVQNAIHLVFRKFQELGSARQVLLWCRLEQITLPATGYSETNHPIYWKLPLYHTILAILTNPMYAGAYAFGRTEVLTKMSAGRARRTQGHRKPQDRWTVLIRDHHAGYITWEQFELNQNTLAENARMKSRMGRQSGRGGRSLLVGLVRCCRCSRMLRVHYLGKGGKEMRYQCINGHINQGVPKCISFGGVRVDKAVSDEILKVVQPVAIDAAVRAVEQKSQQQSERARVLELELEQARYEARLAGRRYEAVDPDNRLVASELEARWNTSLCRVKDLESNLDRAMQETSAERTIDKHGLLRLAEDLPTLWESPSTDMGVKQRIVRILIQEIVANVDEQAQEVVLVIHWVGGRHSELRVPKMKSGHHCRCTKAEAVDIVRQMASTYKDEEIALTLNRLGLKTGVGNTWNEMRVRSLRQYLKLPACRAEQRDGRLNLEAAAVQLGVSATVVRRLIEQKLLPATQIVFGAPWQLDAKDVASSEVIKAAMALKNRVNQARHKSADNRTLPLPGLSEESNEDGLPPRVLQNQQR